MTVLLIALAAAVGAPLRYLTDRAIQARHKSAFPWGTLTVNVAGSMLLGFLVGLPAQGAAMAILGTGLCGALTTYSTFSYLTVRLAQDGAYFHALANVVVSVVACLGAGFCGVALAEAVAGGA
jgi:fluoride exporter